MIVDLHVHTRPLSPCSDLDPLDAIEAAKKIGLDGICFTEHNRLWDEGYLKELRSEHNFPIFRGMEVDTTGGHVIVFGLDKNIEGVVPAEELRKDVKEAGGVMIAAHPFRGFLLFGFSNLSLNLDEACERDIFKLVDTIEIYSGKLTDKENNFAKKVSRKLNLQGTGGSDAHSLSEVGKCVTIFENNVYDEEDLKDELKEGRFEGGYLRK